MLVRSRTGIYLLLLEVFILLLIALFDVIQAIFLVTMLVPVAFGEKDRLYLKRLLNIGAQCRIRRIPYRLKLAITQRWKALFLVITCYVERVPRMIRSKDQQKLASLHYVRLHCCFLVTCCFCGMVSCIHYL